MKPLGRERNWLVIVDGGQHVTIGRSTDPTPDEIVRIGQALDTAGAAGWLAVSEGGYYHHGPVSLLMVRRITTQDGDWPTAERRWRRLRRAANDCSMANVMRAEPPGLGVS